jgi:hypothetical protein
VTDNDAGKTLHFYLGPVGLHIDDDLLNSPRVRHPKSHITGVSDNEWFTVFIFKILCYLSDTVCNTGTHAFSVENSRGNDDCPPLQRTRGNPRSLSIDRERF